MIANKQKMVMPYLKSSLWAKLPHNAIAIHSPPTNKYNTASDDPWMITDNKIEYGIGSGSGKCFDHNIALRNSRDAVIMKNDEQRISAACNDAHLNTSAFGVTLIWWRNDSNRIVAKCAGIQCENCCTIRAAVMPNEFFTLKINELNHKNRKNADKNQWIR